MSTKNTDQIKEETKDTPIMFEDVDCMLCGSQENQDAGAIEWKGERLEYSLCCNCGLKFMNPRPTEQWYHRFYASEFWDDRIKNLNWRRGRTHFLPWQWHRRGLKGRLLKQKQRARELMPTLEESISLDKTANVLDIGCAFGVVLGSIADKWGCSVYGVEPGKVAREYAEQNLDVKFIGQAAEDLISLKDYDGFFDLIMFSNVLENIIDPKPVLDAIRRLLKPNGIVYIDSPNYYYYDSMNPYHPYIFSPDTLRELLSQAGLQVTTIIFEESAAHRATPLRIKRYRRERFITVLATPGEKKSILQTPVDVAPIVQDQKESLSLLALTRKAFNRTPQGIIEAIRRVK